MNILKRESTISNKLLEMNQINKRLFIIAAPKNGNLSLKRFETLKTKSIYIPFLMLNITNISISGRKWAYMRGKS